MLKHKITNHGIKKEKSTDIETKTWLEKIMKQDSYGRS